MCEHCIEKEDCTCNACNDLKIKLPVYCFQCRHMVYFENQTIKMADTEKYPNKTKIKDDLGTLKDYYFNLRELEQQLGQYQMHVVVYVMIKGLSFRDERDEAWEYYGIRKMNRKVYRVMKKGAHRRLLRILSIRRNIETYQYNIKEEEKKKMLECARPDSKDETLSVVISKPIVSLEDITCNDESNTQQFIVKYMGVAEIDGKIHDRYQLIIKDNSLFSTTEFSTTLIDDKMKELLNLLKITMWGHVIR